MDIEEHNRRILRANRNDWKKALYEQAIERQPWNDVYIDHYEKRFGPMNDDLVRKVEDARARKPRAHSYPLHNESLRNYREASKRVERSLEKANQKRTMKTKQRWERENKEWREKNRDLIEDIKEYTDIDLSELGPEQQGHISALYDQLYDEILLDYGPEIVSGARTAMGGMPKRWEALNDIPWHLRVKLWESLKNEQIERYRKANPLKSLAARGASWLNIGAAGIKLTSKLGLQKAIAKRIKKMAEE